MTEKTVLIAEDLDTNFLLLEYILKNICRVLRAHNGQEAVDMVNTHHVDLVLMDMKMPVMDGVQATKLIKQSHPDIPIVAVTAHMFDESMAVARDAGCQDILAKPVSSKTIRELVLNLDKKEESILKLPNQFLYLL